MANSSGVELVYGEAGEGLVFLERSYAEDVAAFRDALYRATTWGELRERAPQGHYEETVEQWMESKLEDEEIEVPPPSARDPFVSSEIRGYEDGDWPEFAPRAMEEWVSRDIIDEYGGYIYPTLNAEYPLIDFESEDALSRSSKRKGTPVPGTMIWPGTPPGEASKCWTKPSLSPHPVSTASDVHARVKARRHGTEVTGGNDEHNQRLPTARDASRARPQRNG